MKHFRMCSFRKITNLRLLHTIKLDFFFLITAHHFNLLI